MAKVLLVDDERDLIDLVTYLLAKEGHTVLEAVDGKEGLEIARTQQPDAIILDVMMPSMDGYTMNNRLLEDPKTSQIPVLILTARGQMKDMFTMAKNVRFSMDKPFDPKELLKNLSDMLGRPSADQ